jgi:glycosyltransferase involved in cell wall biosynthesis
MARIALIETYPYEAVAGGDAVYLDAIRCFLTERGHAVDTYVTDVTRGRSNPAVTLRTDAARNHRWRVRNAVRLGPDRFCSLDPRFVGKALRRLPRRRAPKDDSIEVEEAEWLAGELQASPPDLVILAFGACALATRIAALAPTVLALKGFFSDRRIRLGDALPTPFIPAEFFESIAHASVVGFNNRHDLEHYAQLSGRKNAVLVGMGLQPRTVQPSDGPPVLLYVAARTIPNVDSLHWFLQEVWPLVRSAKPETELRIAGSIAAAFPGRDANQVRFLGFVDRLEDEYRRSWTVIAPFVNGSSGVKTKVIEALSFGRPVVTTSIGVDPEYPDAFGEAVIAADDPLNFAAAVLEALHDEETRRTRHGRAVEQFGDHFTPEAAYRNILDLIEPTVDRQRVAAR